MTSFNRFIFSCPQCSAQLCGKRLKTDAAYFTELYSDGKMISEGIVFTDFQAVVCPSCAHAFWLENEKTELQDTEVADYLVYPFQTWYLFGLDRNTPEGIRAMITRLQMLVNILKPYTNEQELYLRKLLLWAYNDLVRIDEEYTPSFFKQPLAYLSEKRKRRKNLKAFQAYRQEYVANISRLIELLRIEEDKAANIAFIAELFREKGKFAKCLEILDKAMVSTHYLSEIHERASKENALVFKVAG